jgi:ribosome-associated toxin RatA of RatAB toxin-antitoxin module
MKQLMATIVGAVLCAVALAGLPASAQAGSGMVLSHDVREGNIESSLQPHAGTSVQWGRAIAVVDAPAADVMGVIQDYAGYKSFLPNFQASRVLSQRGASALVYMQVSILHGTGTIWAEVKLRPRQSQGATQILEGKMTKGNVHLFEAMWEVTPLDAQHSVVAFQILVDPDMPLPSSLINGENQKTARKTIHALRELMAQRKAHVAVHAASLQTQAKR